MSVYTDILVLDTRSNRLDFMSYLYLLSKSASFVKNEVVITHLT